MIKKLEVHIITILLIASIAVINMIALTQKAMIEEENNINSKYYSKIMSINLWFMGFSKEEIV